MAEYQPNSHRSKELQNEDNAREKRVNKVVSGAVSTRENKGRKFLDTFISEDTANVKSYIFMDVLVPAIKETVSTIVKDAVDIILFGGSGGSSSRGRSGSKISYRSFYNGGRDRDRRDATDYTPRGRFDYDDIEFNSRGEAQLVIDQLNEIIEEYQFATVADMYDLAGLIPPHTSNNYGWTSIRTAEPVRVRGGKYIVKLPKASPID